MRVAPLGVLFSLQASCLFCYSAVFGSRCCLFYSPAFSPALVLVFYVARFLDMNVFPSFVLFFQAAGGGGGASEAEPVPMDLSVDLESLNETDLKVIDRTAMNPTTLFLRASAVLRPVCE